MPLYYFWLFAVLVFMPKSVLLADVDAANVIFHVLFLSFLDYRITNTILGVEWSIPIEVVWYLLVPLLLPLATSTKRVFSLVAVSFAAYIATRHLQLPAENPALAMHWSPLPYFFCYALGTAAFRLRGQPSVNRSNAAFTFVVLLLASHVLRPQLATKLLFDELVIVSPCTFALVHLGSPRGIIAALLANRPMIYLGTISMGFTCRTSQYSAYSLRVSTQQFSFWRSPPSVFQSQQLLTG